MAVFPALRHCAHAVIHAVIEDEDEIFGFRRLDSWRSSSHPVHAGPVMLSEGQTSGESEAENEAPNGDSADEIEGYESWLFREGAVRSRLNASFSHSTPPHQWPMTCFGYNGPPQRL